MERRTYSARPSEVQRAWYVVDAEGNDPRAAGHGDRGDPARQAQGDPHAAYRHPVTSCAWSTPGKVR